MKKKWIWITAWIMMAAFIGFSFAWSSNHPDSALPTTKDVAFILGQKPITIIFENMKEATVNAGSLVAVVLEENASTGYHWVITNQPQGLKIIKDATWYHQPPGRVGAGGYRVYGIQADKPGIYELVFSYMAPDNTTVGKKYALRLTVR